MKVSPDGADRFQIDVSEREKELLRELLKLYPLVPDTQENHPAGTTTSMPHSAHLLRETLAGHRQEAGGALRKILDGFTPNPHSKDRWHTRLSRSELEILLQGLNDIRVGSWIRLGSPDFESKAQMEINSQNAHYFWAMELCGAYLSAILHGLSGQTGEPGP